MNVTVSRFVSYSIFIWMLNLLFWSGQAREVYAAFDAAQIKCREAISRQGAKHAEQSARIFADCHRKRSRGRLGQSSDCNDPQLADLKERLPISSRRLVDLAESRCEGLTPSDLDYEQCPAPCDSVIGNVSTFTDVADCMSCLIESASSDLSTLAQGLPLVPLPKSEEACHQAIGKNYRLLEKMVLKERRRCQKQEEAAGQTGTASCSSSDPNGKIAKQREKSESAILAACDVPGIDLFAVDSCNRLAGVLLAQCVLDGADTVSDTIFRSLYSLSAAEITTTTSPVTTTTNSVTTTTLGGGQDPLCPSSGEIILFAGVRETACASNVDCDVDGVPVGICDGTLGRCVTRTRLDTGWTGIAHGQDINDEILTRGELRCPGPFDAVSSEPCGQCEVLGLETAGSDLCRCSTDNSVICTEKFAQDPGSCGVPGVTCSSDSDCRVCDITTSQICLVDADCPSGEVCLTGPRTPSCVNNQCVGTCECYFGPPLPLSAGNVPACAVNKFAEDVTGTVNVDLGEGEISARLASVVFLGELVTAPCPYCQDDLVVNDGVRDGSCVLGEDDGKPCDAQSVNLSFPGPNGGGHSLDCFPAVGKNVSGTGLKINLDQSTSTQTLTAGIACGYSFNPQVCQCGVCSGDSTRSCSSSTECATLGLGDCVKIAQGSPSADTCDASGVCVDLGENYGECSNGPINTYCDGILRADGAPYISCLSDSDCDTTDCGSGPGVGLCGTCSLQSNRQCFLPTIEAAGSADPGAPVGAAVFCLPPTSSAGINGTAGLPGPARVINQARSQTFCSSDPAVEYLPGVGGCPAE